MSRHVSALALASDIPLSPLSDHSLPWDAHLQPTGLLYSPTPKHGSGFDAAQAHSFVGLYPYHLPPSPPRSIPSPGERSPVPVSKVLKNSRRSTPAELEQPLCLPTHQVFDIPPGGLLAPSPSPSPSPSPAPFRERLSISINPSLASLSLPAKRASTSTASTSKKTRTATSTKDFVPPDVSGLSKREARLVKNRAAAFLSRQRKREEFECMEVRVAELEQENARLLAIAQAQQAQAQQDEELVSEVETLRQQLAEMQERERALAKELSRKTAVRSPSPAPSTSSLRSDGSDESLRPTKGEKSGTSLGLMAQVLLCALPSLLSVPNPNPQSPLSNTISLPQSSSIASSSLDAFLASSSEFDWSLATPSHSAMDLDFDMDRAVAPPSNSQTIELVDGNDAGLGALDISFDAQPAENGKIRVRIHPSSAPSSSAGTPSSFSSASSAAGSPPASSLFDDDHTVALWGETSGSLGPFLNADAYESMEDDILARTGSPFDFDFDAGTGEFSRAGSPGAVPERRRVRIALRSMPGKGHEGGEWEVELC
ncbi:uncharacterized protein LAESUDRAFT_321576 [Laetiporus sulphureus 93-53]|uniref:BZIP domain-containing protein n=1 Tax=Laetiporus sulphureus 93-53 TaxID=1314785 RepID=A0A165D1T1_9APHY|nr:uncharacterized protein LAESUDRAFT_321576 [Laetiporus sulphureus 93-53]KZT03980.1 hypothetical protein LAESUDRAFT_321576 [Laetiporus sulphureus 93-53]